MNFRWVAQLMANDERTEQRAAPAASGQPAAMPLDRAEESFRGRHDIVEEEDTGFFWPEVDDMLSGEFSRELAEFRELGPYGVIPAEEVTPSAEGEMNGARTNGEKQLDGDDSHVVPADDQPPIPPSRPSPPHPGPLAASRLSEDVTGSLFSESTAPAYEPPEEPSVSLFEALDALPELDADLSTSSQIRWTTDEARPQVSRLPESTVSLPIVQARLGAPIINLPSLPTEPKLSTPAAAPPVTLEHSTVVDPQHGPPPGSSFTGETGLFGRERLGVDEDLAIKGLGAEPDPQFQLQEASAAFGAPGKLDVVRDVLDRGWVATALVGVVALTLGAIGWVVLASGRDGGTELVTATTGVSTTASEPTSSDGAGASQTTLPATTELLTTSSGLSSAVAGPATSARPVTTRPRVTTTVSTTSSSIVSTSTSGGPSSTSVASTSTTQLATTTRPTTTTTRPTTTSQPTTTTLQTTTTRPTTTTTQPTTTTTQSTTTTTTNTTTTTTTTQPTTTTTTTQPTTTTTEATTTTTEATTTTL